MEIKFFIYSHLLFHFQNFTYFVFYFCTRVKLDKLIEISSQNNKNNVILTIRDNGCGISKSDLTRVCEKGFTCSDRKKEYATGMGLYLSKKLCEKLGLSLKIDSIQDKYTEVKIIFPKNSIIKF